MTLTEVVSVLMTNLNLCQWEELQLSFSKIFIFYSLQSGGGFQIVQGIFIGLVKVKTFFGVGGRDFADKRFQGE